jgi:ribosome biogenesis GTPase
MLKVQTGQIVEFYSNSCLVLVNGNNFKCKIQGRINLVVGDFVEIEPLIGSNNYQALVKKRLDRSSILYKSRENTKKPIASNISHIGILVTRSPKTGQDFIDKWIAISINASIEPFIIFNKIDSLEENAFSKEKNVYGNIGIKTFEISAKFLTNLSHLKEFLAKKTTIFVGNSGSGKSTLTSAITGKEILSRDLSNNQGVHTTSVSTLYNTHNMQLIDSPGVRDVSLDHLEPKKIIRGFTEILSFSTKCEFPNCNHKNDQGCAVTEAVRNGEIEESRYNNFIVLSQKKLNE